MHRKTRTARHPTFPQPPATTLKDAGTQASSRTLTVANSQAYGDIESSLPDNWKYGQATIKYAK